MNKVKILIQGYAHINKEGNYVASSTTTLVESNAKKFLVDPGTNKEELLKALKENNISEKDLEFIYLTHWHPDHFLNIKLFPNLDVVDGTTIWRGDLEIEHKGNLPGMDIEIISTPGHNPENSSLLIETEKGKLCICSDVFWWEDGKQKTDSESELLDFEDPFATDMKELRKSRKLVLSKADWIIPGHGKMFKVKI